jgi:hypothetical protein
MSKHRGTSQQIRLLMLVVSIMITTHIQVVRSYAIVPNPPIHLPKNTYTLAKSTAPQTTKVRYNLGIRPSSDNEMTDDIARVTQYWVEYESVNQFPSPLKQLEVTAGSDTKSLGHQRATSSDSKKKATHQHAPLIPSRLTDDKVLKIITQKHRKEQTSSFDNNYDHVVKAIAHPTMRSGHDFDINTAWIELLIHEQQMKLSSTLEKADIAAAIA